METRNEPRKRRSSPVRFFYLGDKLYKVLYISRPQDLVYTYCFTDEKEQTLVWSHTKKHMQKALRSYEVGKLINRSNSAIKRILFNGLIPAPQRTYDPKKPENKDNPQAYNYQWSHQDIYNLHDYLVSIGTGARKPHARRGPWKLPTRAELTAMLQDDLVLYVKTSDGEYSPVWKEHNW